MKKVAGQLPGSDRTTDCLSVTVVMVMIAFLDRAAAAEAAASAELGPASASESFFGYGGPARGQARKL